MKREYKKKFKELKKNGNLKCAKKILNELEKNIILKLQKKTEGIQTLFCDKCCNVRRDNIQQELNKLGIHRDTIYFHINGHVLEKEVVSPLIRLLLCEVLIPIRRKTIIKNHRHTKFDKHLEKYKPLKEIKPNTTVDKGLWLKKNQEDIKNFINDPNNQKEWFQSTKK